MANDQSKRLAVDVVARIDQLEKGMAKAANVVNRRSAEMESRTKKLGNVLRSTAGAGFTAFGATALAALGPVVLATSALAKAKEAVNDFDRIAKDAKGAGLDAEFFQVIAHGADLAGVDLGELNASLIAFVRNSGLAAVGQGELVGKLKALNPELLKAIQNAKTQDERFRLVADAVQKAGSATEKAALASAAFGRNGAKMVELLKDGSAGFDSLAVEARNLGLVIDRELLAKAELLNDQMGVASRVMDLEFKKALIDLAPFLVSTARYAAGLAGEFAKIVDQMKALENQSSRGLNDELTQLGMERLEVERKILEAQDAQRSNTSVLAGAEGKLDMPVLALKDRAEAIAKSESEILAILKAREATIVTPTSTPSTTAVIPTAKTPRNKAAEDAIREAEAVRELIAELQAERAAISMTDVERAKSEALRRAGAAATAEQRAEIGSLIEAIYREDEATRKAAETAAFFRDTAYGAFADLIPQIETGNSALDKFVNTMIEAVAQAALLGKGPLASLFGGGGGLLGGLFGGGGGFKANTTLGAFLGAPSFAGGGTTGTGARTGGVDGKGGFKAILHPNETIIDHTKMRQPRFDMAGANRGGGVSVSLPINIDATGADAAGLARVEDAVNRLRSELPGKIVSTVKEARTRRILN